MKEKGQGLNLKERGSVSRSTVENQDASWLYLRALTAKPLRVADPRSLPRGQIKTLPVFALSNFFMKCFKHKTEAVAVCSYCGRAMCEECMTSPTAPRMVCSADCGAALERNERAMQSILEKSVQSLKASAFYCYLCAGLSGGGAIVAWRMLPSPFLILF